MTREIQKTFDPVGRLQLFALVKVETATCAECEKEKTSKKWAILDRMWSLRICNGCYGQICAAAHHEYLLGRLLTIQITLKPPLESKHGMTEGRVLDAVNKGEPNERGNNGYWVMGDAGEEVKILTSECEVL